MTTTDTTTSSDTQPVARLHGGPLAGCQARTRHGQTTLRIPAHHGRYVLVDADDWHWETDAPEEHP